MAKVISAERITNSINHNVEVQTAHRRDFRKLPRAKDARIVPCTNTGKFSDGQFTTKSWNIEVDVVVGDKVVTHPFSTWLVGAGMKCTTARFNDLAKAKAMKKEILTKWGKYYDDAAKKAHEKHDLLVEKLAKKLGCTVADIESALAD